jgi:ferritin-like metal-binding protein YciE
MGLLGNLQFNNLNDLFVHELMDLYDAEHRLTDALPKMAEAAGDPQLRQAFDNHLLQTKTHITRLEQVFREINCEAKRETCPAMQVIIKEGQEMLSATGDPSTKDAALIASAQRAEHYEIAGYGTLRTFARELGKPDIARVLQQTLDEEGQADKLLTQIAESRVNLKAEMHA